MAAGSTFTPIATQTLGSIAASVTFSSIPSTYTDLVLIVNGAESSGSGDFIGLQYNGDTGSNYSNTYVGGNGSTTINGRASNYTNARFGAFYTTGIDNAICHIQNYSNTTTYKTALSRSNSAGNNALAMDNLWRSTAAINSVKVLIEANNFATGSTFTLWGILNA